MGSGFVGHRATYAGRSLASKTRRPHDISEVSKQTAVDLIRVYSQSRGLNVPRCETRARGDHSFSQRVKMSEVPKGKRVQARQDLGLQCRRLLGDLTFCSAIV